jgi:photosystem II stability/assembly factor-like uncharacterized protein
MSSRFGRPTVSPSARPGPPSRFSRSKKRALLSPLGLAIALLVIGGAGAITYATTNVGSRSPVVTSSGSLESLNTASPSAVLAAGPDQSKAPDVPITAGEEVGLANSHFGNFNAVACATASNCVAAGAGNDGNGIASISTDGGSSWTSSTLPAGTPALDAITCVDKLTCTAVGQGATASTTDGGSHWSLSALPVANTTMLGVSCPTTSTCLSVGVTSNPEGPYAGAIVRSTDGASTWSNDTLPRGTQGIGDVVCPNATQCIAVGQSILESNDAGVSWTAEGVPGGTQALRSVACSSATTCVAIGANAQGLANPGVPTVAIVTTDGGNTWAQDSFPANTASLDQISCSASGQCFAGGPSETQGGPAPFLSSGDGGLSWTPATTSPSGISAIAGLSCPAANDCAVVGRAANGQAATSASQDGTTWASALVSGQTAPPPNGAPSN